MVTVNADFSNGGMAARYERPTAPSVATPASADRPTLEAPNQAVTAAGETWNADPRRRELDVRQRRGENAPNQGNEAEAAAVDSNNAASEPAAPVFHRRFDKNVAYDEEFKRTFTDITLTSDVAASQEGLSIRIPSENLVKRLNAVVATMTSAEGPLAGEEGVDLDV